MFHYLLLRLILLSCSTNNLLCATFCGCSIDQCTNRTSIRMKIQSTETATAKPTSLLINNFSLDDDYDEDTEDEIEVDDQPEMDCDDDNDNDEDVDEDALKLIYEHNESSHDKPVH